MLGVEKHSLNFKREKNGRFLKVHNTTRNDTGEIRQIRFIRCDVTKTNDTFAAVDEDDNIFVFNLPEKCFWKLPEAKVHNISTIKFVPQQSNNLLIGNKSGFIYEIEINSGATVRCIKAFSEPVNQLLFLPPEGKSFVASSSNQIKIYGTASFVKTCEFRPKDEATIVLLKLIPHVDRLFSVMNNNIVCILTTTALKLIRHFEPLKARQKYLQKSNQKMEKLNYIYNSHDDDDVDKLIKTVTRSCMNGIIVDVSFVPSGSSFCVSFIDNSMMFCSTTMWDVRRVIKFPDFYVKQCEFIIPPHENKPTLLLTSTSNDDLMLINLDELNSKIFNETQRSVGFEMSSNGKILLDIQQTGEIFAYNVDHCLNELGDTAVSSPTKTDVKCTKQVGNEWNAELDKIQMKLNKAMPIGRLLPILKEFGEYPDKYRPMIWKTILKLPQNFDSFARLLKREQHSSVANFDKRYSLVDRRALKVLRKITSCLAHWTSIFGYVNYLPKFVFPFLKLVKGDLLLCFEVIATILNNHCQLWFEFAPLQMPYNYLCLVENVLSESDRKLFEFYKSKGITAKIYALPMMETAFSEVLDERQWLQLWDHIISNDPYFLLFVIVAYNSMMSSTIMRYEKVESVEKVFHEQNYVNFKKLITKAYSFMEKCPSNIHPNRYMKPFIPLASGEYQKFENYPKSVSDVKINEIDALRAEQKILDAKLAEMESFEKAISSRMDDYLMDEEYEKRMREVESTYEKALEEEEERITYQRKMLLLSIKKIRERENEMLIQARNSFLNKRVAASENELETMLRNLEKQRTREEIELQLVNENMKLRQMTKDVKSFDAANSAKQVPLEERFKQSIREIENQKRKFMLQIEKLDHCSSETTPSSRESSEYDTTDNQPKIEELERIFQTIQIDYVQTVDNKGNGKVYKDRMKLLEKKSEQLEQEVCQLLESLQC